MMTSNRLMMRAAMCTLVMCAITSPARAQVPWESPQLLAPGTPAGASLMFVDYGLSPDDGTGLLLTYRAHAAPRGPGLRVASTMPGSNRMRVSGGADYALPMFSRTASFPLDVLWTTGFGAGYGDWWSVAIPVGVSAGRTMGGSSVAFAPYTAARVVMEGYFGGDHPDETFALLLAAEIGTDVWLRKSGSVRLRTAVALGDRRALAVGLHVGGSGTRTMAAQRR